MSSSTGTAGEPRWASGDAPSLSATFNELSEFALKRGNMLKGTTAQRTAFSSAGYAVEGDQWRDTTLKTTFVFESGVWLEAVGKIEVGAITPSVGTTITSQRLVKQNGAVELTARFERAASITSTQALGQLPAGFQPSVIWAFSGTSAMSVAASAALRIGTDGALSYIGTTSANTFWVSCKYQL